MTSPPPSPRPSPHPTPLPPLTQVEQRKVEVVLPADVVEGQKLSIAMNGGRFAFTVPPGVSGGQKLHVALPIGFAEAHPARPTQGQACPAARS